MKIDLELTKHFSYPNIYSIAIIYQNKYYINKLLFSKIDLNDIQDIETNLTEIIKQLQDYRMKQNHG